MESMKIEALELPEVKLITPEVFEDERGFFFESYSASKLVQGGIDTVFVQDNHSYSKQGVIRGLHYQKKPGQAKLISVVEGEIFDVAVDIRKASRTYLQWVGVHLSSQNHQKLYIPVGFAHGFAVLSPSAQVQYKVSSEYDPDQERSIFYADEAIGIDWPVENPILSMRDRQAPKLKKVEVR